jgi:hypothetical protein
VPAASLSLPVLVVDRILLFALDNELFVRFHDAYSLLLSGDTTAVTLLHPNSQYTRHLTSCVTHTYRLKERVAIALQFRSRVVGCSNSASTITSTVPTTIPTAMSDPTPAADDDVDTVAISPGLWPPTHQSFTVRVLSACSLLAVPVLCVCFFRSTQSDCCTHC